jgi:hypothetical protein
VVAGAVAVAVAAAVPAGDAVAAVAGAFVVSPDGEVGGGAFELLFRARSDCPRSPSFAQVFLEIGEHICGSVKHRIEVPPKANGLPR